MSEAAEVSARATLGCAAGYNLRLMLRAIARLGIRAVFCVCYNPSYRLKWP